MAQYFVKHRVNFTFYFHLSFHSQQVFRYLKHPLLWDPYVPLLLTQNPSSEPHFYPVSVSANKKSLWKTLRGLRTNSLKVRDKMCGNWDLRLSRRWRFGCWSSGFIRRVTLEVLTNVSEESTDSFFRVESWSARHSYRIRRTSINVIYKCKRWMWTGWSTVITRNFNSGSTQ
jgi:hypothetical protein